MWVFVFQKYVWQILKYFAGTFRQSISICNDLISVKAFQCYQCKLGQKDCFANGDLGSTINCEAPYNTGCAKGLVEGKSNHLHGSGTFRKCTNFPDELEDGDCKEVTQNGLTAEVCYCKSELCNSAEKFNNSIITIISIFVFVCYLIN